MSVTRREFLKVGAAVGGGLLVEVWLPRTARADVVRGGGPFAPSAFLRIAADGVTFICPQVEMGQGIQTGLAMLVAEELEIAPEAMRVVAAPAARAYDNPEFDLQLTGGSSSVKAEYEPLRLAGATAREMLRSAASRRWGVPVAECIASAGAVTHAATGKRATYGELADEAARSEVPRNPPLRYGNFKVIGKPLPRVDARPKIDGTGVFGIDVLSSGKRPLVANSLKSCALGPTLPASPRPAPFDSTTSAWCSGMLCTVFELPSEPNDELVIVLSWLKRARCWPCDGETCANLSSCSTSVRRSLNCIQCES